MRRRAFLLGAAGSLALAACGGDDEDGAGAGGGTLRHEFGTTQLPDAPQRVVAYGYTDADPILALGIVPVLVQQWIPEWKRGVGPWSEPALAGKQPELVASQEILFEKVAAARPDLIVAVNIAMERADYDKLAQIAPTVPQPAGFPPYGVPWQDATRHIGTALGRAGEARRLVAEAEDAFARARADHPAFEGKTGMVVAPAQDGGFSVYADTDTRGRFLTSLGLRQPPEVAKLTGDAFYADVSGERTDLLDAADALVVLAQGVRPGRLDVAAFRERGVVVSDLQTVMAISASTVTSIPYALERIVPDLAERLA